MDKATWDDIRAAYSALRTMLMAGLRAEVAADAKRRGQLAAPTTPPNGETV
jgi:hypothetical protein